MAAKRSKHDVGYPVFYKYKANENAFILILVT